MGESKEWPWERLELLELVVSEGDRSLWSECPFIVGRVEGGVQESPS